MSTLRFKAHWYILPLAVLIGLITVERAYGQCNVTGTQRPDGLVAYQAMDYFSGSIAGDEDLQIVLAPSIIGEAYYVMGLLRWRTRARPVTGEVRIILRDGKALQLEPIEYQEMRSGGSNVTTALYSASADEISHLSNSRIDKLNFRIDEAWHVYTANARASEFRASLLCLNESTDIPF